MNKNITEIIIKIINQYNKKVEERTDAKSSEAGVSILKR